MPRQLRIEYPGAIYHVMNRGDRREDIFRDDLDRQRFLNTLADACGKTGWQVHAWCLMRNHFHLVIETPQPNLVAGMKWLLGVYTKRFNLRHRECGHLFAGRYKALLVDGDARGYLRTVCDYVHLNPVRAKLVPAGTQLEAYRWSSYGEYLKPPGKRMVWLRVDRLLGEKGIPKDSDAGRREFARLAEARRSEESNTDYRGIRRGWCLGREEFRKELLAAATQRVGASHFGSERQETGEAKAERLIAEELKRLNLALGELRKMPKGDKRKVQIARRLRNETTVTLKWVADRLHMGSWTYVSNLVRAQRAEEYQK